jgi:hypothetical protein
MILDTRIKWNGVNVRLVGFGFRKFHNLRIMDAGLKSIKARLAKGIGEDDGPTDPLKKRYARFKSKRTGKKAIRDLFLTGSLLGGLKTRYADDRIAVADAGQGKGARLDRQKARVHKKLMLFSDNDQKAMGEVAASLFREGVRQISGGLSPSRAAAEPRARIRERRTFFGRQAA